MTDSFQAFRSQTRFPSPVLGYGTSRGSLPIITSRRLIRPSKWKTSTRNQSLNIAGTRWTILPTSQGSMINPNRNSAPLVFHVPRLYVLTSILHTPLPIHLTHGQYGVLAALPLLAIEEMASRLPNPRPSWPTSKVTFPKVPVQAKRGSFVNLVSAGSQQLICLLTNSNTTTNTDAASSSPKST